MIKDIVVNLTFDSARDVARDYAVSIADTFKAHLAGVVFDYEPVYPAVFANAGVAAFIEDERAENKQAAEAAIAKFGEATRQAGISSALEMFEASIGGAAAQFAEMARRFDLSVVAQNEPDKGSAKDLLIESALFESGRPVVIVPYIQKNSLKLDRVLVCWDRSKSAARAAADAMPFLERATHVTLLTVVGKHGKHDEPTGAVMADHLKRHGLKVDVERIVSSDPDVASAILSFAADSAASFIVMGGYGHSRLREFVLGGVTRGMLTTMTVPTLMSH